jgi:hypothetical protein
VESLVTIEDEVHLGLCGHNNIIMDHNCGHNEVLAGRTENGNSRKTKPKPIWDLQRDPVVVMSATASMFRRTS